MPKKRNLIMPTPVEDAAIDTGIKSDPDTYELSDGEFKQLKRVGRPRSSSPKIALGHLGPLSDFTRLSPAETSR